MLVTFFLCYKSFQSGGEATTSPDIPLDALTIISLINLIFSTYLLIRLMPQDYTRKDLNSACITQIKPSKQTIKLFRDLLYLLD